MLGSRIVSGPALGAPRARVAIVAVPGIGDERPGDTVDSLAGGILAARGATAAEADRVLVPVGERRARHSVERRRLRRTDGIDVHIYEMAWADLSRFPVGLIAFVRTAIALGLQVPTIGLEAIRPSEGRPDLPPQGRRPLDAALGLGNLASWCLATIALGSLAIAGGLALALWAAVGLAGTPWLPVATIVAVLALLGVAAGALGIRRGGWPATVPVLLVLVAAVAAAMIAFTADDGAAVGLANALAGVLAYVVRPIWIVTLIAVGATSVALAILWSRVPAVRPGAISAMAAFALAPLMIAVIAGGASAAVGAIAVASVQDRGWGTDVGQLRCPQSGRSWTLTRCGAGDPPIREDVLRAAGLHAAAEEARGRADALAQIDPRGSARADARADLFSDEARAAERAAGIAPGTWARGVFGQMAGAMLGGVVAAVVLALGLLVALGGHLVARARLRLERSAPEERRRARLTEVGATLGQGLARLDTPAAAGVLVGGTVAAVVWAVLWWTAIDVALLPGPWASGIAIVIALLLVGLRLFPLGRSAGGGSGGALAALQRAFDLPYDIASYLRLTGGGRRGRRTAILERYRAVLRAVTEARHPDGTTGYDAVVLMGHSQGSLLTATVLFGDPARQEPEAPLAAHDPRLAAHLADGGLSVVTFGSPITQLYDRRLPDQYAGLRTLPTRSATALSPLTGEWLNAYRPGDYVGRAIWADPLAPASSVPGAEAFSATVPGGPRFRDVCLAQGGGHVGYWGDPVLARHLAEVVGGLVTHRTTHPG